MELSLTIVKFLLPLPEAFLYQLKFLLPPPEVFLLLISKEPFPSVFSDRGPFWIPVLHD
jgi:hypothetical protein